MQFLYRFSYRASLFLLSIYVIFLIPNAFIIWSYYDHNYLNFIQQLFNIINYGNLVAASIITIWWGLLTYSLYIIILKNIIFIGNHLYKENRKHIHIYNKYRYHLANLLYPIVNLFTCVFLLLILAFLLYKSNWNLDIENLENILFDLFYYTVPIVYSCFWFLFLKIRKKSNYIDFYLFSKISVRNNLLSIITVMIFFGLLGNVLIPFLLFILHNFEMKITQSVIHSINFINEDSYLKKDFLSISVLGALKHLGHFETINFQNKMFDFLVYVSFVSFFLQLLMKYLFLGKNVKTLLIYALKSTIVSTIFILLVNFYIQRAYYIDTSSYFNSNFLFIFLISCFFMQDTLNIEDPQPNKQQK